MELDHITPKVDKGTDTIDNAIPVCFECHAEIHAYNDKHPRGRKYRPEELKEHKEQWLELCKSSAAFLASVPPRTDVGPFQSLIDELEFNEAVAATADVLLSVGASARFEVAKFDLCITEGILSLLEPKLKRMLIDTYVVLKRVNTQIEAIINSEPRSIPWTSAIKFAKTGLDEAVGSIQKTKAVLSQVLSQES